MTHPFPTSLTAWLARERDACFSVAAQRGPNRTFWIERGYYFTLAAMAVEKGKS